MDIENADIRLRAMEPEDLDLLYHIENDETIWSAGTTNVPYSRYVLRDYMASVTNDIYADKQLRLIIETVADEPETVGIVDLVNFDPRHLRAEVGIVIKRGYRGRGYGVRTLTALMTYARNTLNMHQLYACSDINNKVAIRMFTEAGFRQTAELSDWLLCPNGYVKAALLQYFL